jgi:hypothetical protein
MFEDFAASLTLQMSAAFTPGQVEFGGDCITIYHAREAPGEFVHVVVDFTCYDDIGTVVVHARPDHVFEPHWMDGVDGQVMLAGSHGEPTGEDFDDGYGNTLWMFEHPKDEARIAALANALARICAEYFA